MGGAGTGKTRLALHYAGLARERFAGGAWFCDLSEARDCEGITSAVATVLDVPLGKGDPLVQLGHAIAARGRCLVILDNFEQVVDEAEATLGRWIARAESACFLVTSRERLRLGGEVVQPIGPLGEQEAVDLFVARAATHRPGFSPDAGDHDEIRRIVRLLEALPLAIELAAARVRVMAPRQVAERLSDRFRLLAGGTGDRRHATLRHAIDGSWDLLAPWEQACFAQCSVFEGSFTLEAGEGVLDLSAWEQAPWVVDLLEALVDKSLLRLGAHDGEPRFTLYMSLQEYARQKLAEEGAIERGGSGGDAVRRAEERHGKWYAELGSDEAIDHIACRAGAIVRRRRGRDLDNLVAACRRAVKRRDGATAGAAYRAAWQVIELRGPFRLGVELGKELLGMPEMPKSTRACVLFAAATANHLVGRLDEAREQREEALAIARDVGDRRSEANMLANLGIAYSDQGRVEEARCHLEPALALSRTIGARRLEAMILVNLCNVAMSQGRTDEAQRCLEQALSIVREIADRRLEAVVLGSLAGMCLDQGRMEEARKRFEEATAILRDVGDRRLEAILLGNLGSLHQEQGRAEEAREHYVAALAVHRDLGNRRFEGLVLQNLASLYQEQGRMEEARPPYEAAVAILAEIGDRRFEGAALGSLADLHACCGRMDEARSAFAAGERLLRDVGDRLELAKLLSARGCAEASTGDVVSGRASLVEAESLASAVGAGSNSELGRLIARLHDALSAGGEH